MPITVRVRKRPDRESLQLWYRCPLTGRQITKSAETSNFAAAERAAEVWEQTLVGQAVVGDPTWDQFRTRFEDEFLANKPKNTRTSYTAALNNWERHVGKVRALSLITPSVVSRFAAEFAKTVDSLSTVSQNLRHIRSALRWAEGMEMIKRTPRFVMPKTGKRRLARARAITREEFELMRAEIPNIRPPEEQEAWERLFDVLWLSGLRIGEAMELSWDEPPIMVDLDGGRYPRLIIFVEGQKSREDETSVITPEFASWLRETPKHRREGPVVDLGEFDRSWACHVISECGERAKVLTSKTKYASAHDIRRSYGQRWAKVVRPLTLQKMMRHKSVSTTLGYYVDLGDEDVGSELWGEGTVQRVVQRNGNGSTKQTIKPSKSLGKN